MPQLNQLLNQLPQIVDVRMSTMGQTLWVSWQGNLPQAVSQTLLNYGGILIGEGNGHAVWFFFTNDVFLALARLSIWGNFNELPVSIELFPGRLQFGQKREANIAVDGIISSQELHPRQNLDIFIHPASKKDISIIPGITFDKAALRQGMASSVEWLTPVVDVRLPYSSTQAWFIVLHPLGNPLDKNFQTGWSNMFKLLEEIFQELKIKFIVQEGFVIISIDNLLMLRTFLRKYLRTFDKEKQENGSYWPCVCVVADRKNLNFNSDLPKKIGLKWDSLMPDFPYVSYRNAYLAGEGFVVRDLRFTGGQTNMDSWCNVLLDENAISTRSIPLTMASQLASSAERQECFYCGLSNHSPAECPTRTFFPSQPETWQAVAGMDLDEINDAFRKIELVLTSKGLRGFEDLLEKPGSPGMLLQAVFDLNSPSQLRNVPRNWLYRMKEPDPEEEPIKDDSPAWDLLERLGKTAKEDLGALDAEIAQTITRHQRDPRLRMVRAFLQIERGDPNQAITYFKDAAAITPTPALQAWNEYLQGRVLESQGQYAQASNIYSQIQRVMPQWREVSYRGIVCRVKMGFAEQVLDQIVAMVKVEPEFFNRFLIDPALERGRLLILSALYDLWGDAKKNAESEKTAVVELAARLNAWFPPDHPVQAQLGQKIKQLEAMGNVNNYMAFFQMVKFRPQLERDLNDSIQREIEELRNRYKAYLDVLEEVRDEASWFPFPSALKDFSADFNASAGIINWAFTNNFGESEIFKKAQSALPQLDKLLQNLKKRLKFLRSVRDATLFGLTMFKTFIWIEIIGLLICFLGVPGIVFFGDKIGLGWLKYLLGENQWAIQKVLVVIVTIIAIGAGALRTTLVFDKKRERLLEEARIQRERAQATRVEQVRRKRQAEARRMQKQRAEAQKREAKRQLRAKMES